MKQKSINTQAKSLNKAIAVIKSFTPQELELGSAEVARKVGISRSTAHRILKALAAAGLLEQDSGTRKYTIGSILYFQGSLYLSTRDVLKTAEPVFKELNEMTGEGLNLSIFDNGYITVVMKILDESSYRLDLRIGSMSPAYSSSMGKTFLSELSEAEIDELYPKDELKPITKKTITSKAELKAQLKQVRESGVAFTREEGTEGIEGVASLIRDSSGKAVAAMSFHLPAFRMNEVIRKRFAGLIKMGAELVSYRLGYRDSSVHDIKEIRSWWERNN